MTDQNLAPSDSSATNYSMDAISIGEIIVNLKALFRYLLSKWVILVIIGLSGGAVGYFYAYYKKPVYTSVLTFALEDEKSGGGLGGALGIASQFGIDLGQSAGGAFSGANLIELMKSRSLVEKSLLAEVSINNQKTSLVEYYIGFTKMRKGWESDNNLKNIRFLPNADRSKFTYYQDSILGSIYQTLIKSDLTVAQKDKKVSIITIEVKSVNELFAKYFAETLAFVVSDFYVQTKSKKANLNVAILERQVDSVRYELNSAISGVASANDNTYNLNPSLNIRRVPSAKRQVDVQANTAILTTLVQNLELARVALRKETPLIQVIDLPILPLKKEKPGRLKTTLTFGFLAGFFAVMILILLRWLKKYL